MEIVAIVIGAILGVAALQSVGGLVFGGALGFLVAEVTTLKSRVRALEQIRAPQTPAPTRPATPVTETPAPHPAARPAPVETETPAVAPPTVAAAPQPPPTPSGYAPPTPRPSPEIFDKVAHAVYGFFTEGNTVVRVGIIVLFFGIAFLLKYAAEHARLPIELRLAGVALGAIGLLFVGARVRRKREGYGLTLEGGAIGILSLTIFAAFRLYGLLPAPLAFALLVVTFAACVTLSLTQNSLALAALGISGAFLAPVLASTGAGSHVALFSYFVLVNAAILAIAWFKAWRLLNVLGFVFTFVIGSVWGYRYYRPEFFETTEPFLIVFVLFYLAVALLFARRQPPELRHPVDGTLVFGVPVVGFLLQAALVKDFEYGLAWSAFALGAVYIGMAWVLLARGYTRLLAEAFLALGVIFATLTIPLAVDGHWTAAAWAIEGAGILWVGLRQTRLLAQVFGLLVQLGAGALLLQESKSPGAIAVFNSAFLGAFLVAGAGVTSSYLLERYRDRAPMLQAGHLTYVLLGWGLLWWFGGTFREIERFVGSDYRVSAALGLVAVTTLAQDFAGARLAWPGLRYAALFNIAWLYFFAARALTSFSHPFAKWGFLAWPAAVASYYFTLKHAHCVIAAVQTAIHVGAFWLSVFLIGWEVQWLVDQLLPRSDWPDAVVGVFLGSVLLALLWARLRIWPVREHSYAYLAIGATPLVALGLLWLLVHGVADPGHPSPLPYVPLLNPLDLTALFILLVLLQWGFRTRPQTQLPLEVLAAVLGTATFVWLNAMLFRTLHHFTDVPYTLRAMYGSTLAQAAVSICWTLLAFTLMLVAKRSLRRELWLTGAVLLGVVVVKLFVVDLSGTGTVARIVSFVGVGVLLLVIGYLVPVPPRAGGGKEAHA